MKYVLLDTNIIIDMIIDRKNQINNELLITFIKLLDSREIKLVVPEIIEIETRINIVNQVEIVGQNISKAMNSIDDLYGINGNDNEGLVLNNFKENSKKELEDAKKIFDQNKNVYSSNIQGVIDKLFNHDSTIKIKIDEFLINQVIKRKITKKAPFHHDGKESYGDALIAETLININKYVDNLTSNDVVYFVTGNYKDFSESKSDKKKLHHDILEDIDSKNDKHTVEYITHFKALVMDKLKDEVEKTSLTEIFEEMLSIEKEKYIQEFNDQEREYANLIPLSNYNSQVENLIEQSTFYEKIINIFEKINDSRKKLVQETLDCFYDDLLDSVNSISIDNFTNKLREVNEKFKTYNDELNFEDYNIDELLEFISFIKKQLHKMKSINELNNLPDSFRFGETIDLYDEHLKKFILKFDELSIYPEEGSTESIFIELYDGENDNPIESGRIDITCGYENKDEDGGVADAMEDTIDYQCDDIINKLDELSQNIENYVNKQIEIYKILNQIFEVYDIK